MLADDHGEAGCVHRGGRPGLPPTGRRGAGQVDTHQRGASTPNTVCPARAGIVTVTEGVCAGGEVAAGEERAAGEAEAAGGVLRDADGEGRGRAYTEAADGPAPRPGALLPFFSLPCCLCWFSDARLGAVSSRRCCAPNCPRCALNGCLCSARAIALTCEWLLLCTGVRAGCERPAAWDRPVEPAAGCRRLAFAAAEATRGAVTVNGCFYQSTFLILATLHGHT